MHIHMMCPDWTVGWILNFWILSLSLCVDSSARKYSRAMAIHKQIRESNINLRTYVTFWDWIAFNLPVGSPVLTTCMKTSDAHVKICSSVPKVGMPWGQRSMQLLQAIKRQEPYGNSQLFWHCFFCFCVTWRHDGDKTVAFMTETSKSNFDVWHLTCDIWHMTFWLY